MTTTLHRLEKVESSITRRAQPVRGRWRLRHVLYALAALGVMTIGVLALIASWRPTTYQPPAIDRARLPDDQRDLVNLLDRIGAALNEGRAITFSLEEAQLNRWLAARDELFIDTKLDLPPEVQGPQIRISERGMFELAAQFDTGFFRPVVRLGIAASLEGDDVRVSPGSLYVGGLRLMWSGLPQGMIRTGGSTSANLRVIGNEVLVQNRFTWSNGRRDFSVTQLDFAASRVTITFTPIPRGASGPSAVGGP
ncbi:MAG: hypothetical protein HRU75_02435 [Planctomycetia bacterium]|nr:MAG: hypothetical protein HRU75_02435 [Planctomycetia bacterium]